MNGCKSSCITLAAIAGASAAIAGGILAVSSATADSPRSATLAATATAVHTDKVVADREALAVSTNNPIPSGIIDRSSTKGEYFAGSFDDLRARMRIRNMVLVDEAWLESSGTPGSHKGNKAAAGSPFAALATCDGPVSGSTQEDDNLAVIDGGSGLDENSSLDCVSGSPPANPYEGWRGKNDMCFPGPGSTDFEDPTLLEDLPDFTAPGQVQMVSGRTARINNSCMSGDSQGRSKQYDGDVWHFEITAPALDIKIELIAETDGLWALPLYNFEEVVAGNGFLEIDDCQDQFGTYNSWVPQQSKSGTDCTTGDVFQESLQAGHWYVLIFPNFDDGPAAGEFSPDGDAFWYNCTISSVNPEGACCNTETGICTDNTLKTVCFGNFGVFQGPESTCDDSFCCSPITDLGALSPDWEENDQATYGPDSELRCNTPGAENINEGVNQDFFNGDVINCEETPLAEVGDPGFTPADICAGDEYVIVAYSGTADQFSSSFAADSIDDADSDMFAFQISGPDPVRVEATFSVPFPYVGYIVRNLGFDPLSPDCSIAGFNSPGITSACQQTDITQTLPGDGSVHGLYMYPYTQSGVACTVRYTIILHCLQDAPGACCLKNGECMDNVVDTICEFDLHANFQGEYSSCCASVCESPCDSSAVNPPTNLVLGAQPDDNCTNYTTYGPYGATTPVASGDLYNSGCESPDNDTEAYWSLAPGTSDRLWCGSTGTYIEDTGGGGLNSKNYVGDYDYYELDLSGASGDTQCQITVQSQVPLNVYVAQEKGRTECPTELSEGTTDIRELTRTLGVSTAQVGGFQQATLTACLAPDKHILLIECTIIIDCGFSYTAQIDYEDDCLGACCVPGAGCTNVAEDSADAVLAEVNCDALKGTYRGLGTRCPGTQGTNPLGLNHEIECCTVASEPGDVMDADAGTCTHAVTNDVNGGCASEPDKPFQDLGTLDWSGNLGPSSVSVYGTTGNNVPAFGQPSKDRDFYKFTMPPGIDAELLFTVQVDFRELLAILDEDDLDPTGACNWSTTNPDSAQLDAAADCAPGQAVFSGLQSVTARSDCLDAGEDHYVFMGAARQVKCSGHYRFELELFECRRGACCLDNSLCVGDNDIGYLECEVLLGGTFNANASCPMGDLEGTMCLGVCCLDDDMNEATPPVCTTDTLYQECCLGNGALDQLDPQAPGFTQGSWIGYSVGDNPAACSPSACDVTGACCIDSAGGYSCTDSLTPADCSTMGGSYQGDNSLCADSPCDALNGACCVSTVCQADKSPLECAGLTGTFLGAGSDCSGDPCAPVGGACCHACPNGNTCVDSIADDAACAALGGLYAGSGTTCGSFNCSSIKKGDLDGDGTVTVFDFAIFSSHFGSGGDRCDGDLDCDGTVTVFDFAIFSSDFGQSGATHTTCP